MTTNPPFQTLAANRAVRILGVTVNPLTIKELNTLIHTAIEKQQCWIIAHHNLHSLYLYHHLPKMRQFYDVAEYSHCDGMSLVFLGKLLGLPLRREHRVTFVDWIDPLMAEAAQQGWRVFYLGSKPGIADKGSEILRLKFPQLQIQSAHGYFDFDLDSEENRLVREKINHYSPHILMVGMGMPTQEWWILDNYAHLQTNVILPSGACIDYVAGAIPTPPRWLGRIGLEWFYRLITEPRRLWRRYLVEPWFLLGLLVKYLLQKYFGF
jgi:N-acetylglucosaminyldiphosphoundecaprenol N-acetyl-beta-D-mannosaminyltransferase